MKAGDLICGFCGEGNDPTRNFCRRCGNSLAEAVVKRDRWWRRLFRRRQRVAGDRPDVGSRRVRRWVIRLVALAVAVALAVTFLDPVQRFASRGYQWVRALIDAPERLHPTAAANQGGPADHGACLAIDGLSKSYWEAGTGADGHRGILLVFPTKVEINRIGVTPGVQDPPGAFFHHPRPRRIEVTFYDTEKQLEVRGRETFTVADDPAFQDFTVHADGASVVVLRIVSTYGSQAGADPKAPVVPAVAELEFWGHQGPDVGDPKEGRCAATDPGGTTVPTAATAVQPPRSGG